MVEPLPHHPKGKSSTPATDWAGREKMLKVLEQIWQLLFAFFVQLGLKEADKIKFSSILIY